MSVVTYLFGIAYERIVNGVGVLEPFRVVMIAKLRKATESAPA